MRHRKTTRHQRAKGLKPGSNPPRAKPSGLESKRGLAITLGRRRATTTPFAQSAAAQG